MLRKYTVYLCFLSLCLIQESAVSKANPPEKWLILKKVQGSLWINKSATWALNTYTTRLLKKHKLGPLPRNKKQLLDSSSTGTVGVVLYEFTTGTGSKTRYFYDNSPFCNELKTAPGLKYVLNQYVEQYPRSHKYFDSSYNLKNIRYQFSPIIKPLKFQSFEHSFIEHVRAVNNGSLEQFLLGSFYADVVAVDSDELIVHIWNHTSKSSLMLHVANSVQRPQPFGTVTQHAYIRLTYSQVNEILGD